MRDRPTETLVISAPDKLSLELEGLLRAKARRMRLSKNETLYVRGSSPESIFCVESGAIQLSATSLNGREAVLNVVEPGRWFGELTVLIEEPRAHDAKALLSTDLLVVPAACLHEIVDNKPAYLLEFLRLVCHRYKWAMERIDAAILQPLSVRLAHRLLAAQATSSVEKATGHLGTGDFLMTPEGRLSRAGGMPGLVYLGAQIIRTETLDGFPEAVFSLNRVWDRMIGLGRVFGLVHQGGWCDVGRPDGIASAESLLAKVDDVS